MSVKLKPLIYLFIVFIIIFAFVGFVVNKTVLPAKQEKVFGQLHYSVVNIIDDIDKEKEKLSFTVKENSTLLEAVVELKQVIQGTEYEHYAIALKNEDNNNEQLEHTWTAMQFQIYEIMGQKNFTQLSIVQEQLNNSQDTLQIKFEMDEAYVYVTLSDGEESLHRMLPIHYSELRTWG